MPLPTNIEKLLGHNSVESERIEYKENWNPEGIMHTICAFANDIDDFGGGYIVVGVKANNGIPTLPLTGLNVNQIDKIEGEIVQYCKNCLFPAYLPVIEVVTYENKNVVVIWAYSGDDRPFECLDDVYGKNGKNKSCYIRKGSNTIKATNKDKNELIKLNSIISFDDRLNRNASIMDLKASLIKEYLYEIGSDLFQNFDDLSQIQLCESLRIIGGPSENLRPKNVGLLFFNDDPEKFVPYSYIQVDYVPDPAGEGIKEKKFTGPIQRQLRDALEYIKNNYLETAIVKIDGQAEALHIENYPYAALEELLPNAVLHKDYQIPEPITVRVTRKDIQITSFPGLDGSLKDKDIKEYRMLTRRYKNKRIGENLKELGLVETKNTGIPKVVRALSKNGSPNLEFEMDDERNYVTAIIKIHSQFTDYASFKKIYPVAKHLEDKIVISLKNQAMSITELSRTLGYSQIPNSLKKAVEKLIAAGTVIKTDAKKYKLINLENIGRF